MATATTAQTQYIQAPNNTTFAYRRLGPHNVIPLVLHIHFRANMDFWDPLLIDTLIAQGRPVILFDQSGVGKSSGRIATTYQAWVANVSSGAYRDWIDKNYSSRGDNAQAAMETSPA